MLVGRLRTLALALTLAGAGCVAWAGCAAGGLPIGGDIAGAGGSGGSGGNGGNGGNGGGNGGGGHGGHGGGNGGGGGPASPRLVAPLSTVTVTSRRPRLRWDMSGVMGAATVDLCRDRACGDLVGSATVDPSGAAATPDAELPAGAPIFWRVRAGAQTSATWELFVGQRSAPADGHFGATLDLDGDGVPDVAVATGGGVAVYLGGAGGLGGAPVMLPNPDAANANFGYVVAAAGDVDGDGFGDLAVGECGHAGSAVHVYRGGPGGPATTASQTLTAPDGLAGFGCRLAAAGDLDGDGFADLAVARTGEDFSGGLYVYRGGAGGLATTTTRIDSPDYKPSRLGYSLAGVGDLDGDGYDDLVASEIDASARSGRAHIYRGGPGGIANDRQTTLLSPDPSGLQYGASVAGVGDVDGDGYPDFAVASPSVSTTPLQPTVHVYRGGPGGIAPSSAPTDLVTSGATGFAVEVEAAGDVDGDGYSDVIVASPSTVTLFRGGAGGPGTSGVAVDAAGQGTNPRHLAGAGDLDGDGRADVVVGDGAGLEALFGAAAGLGRARALTVSPPAGVTGSVA